MPGLGSASSAVRATGSAYDHCSCERKIEWQDDRRQGGREGPGELEPLCPHGPAPDEQGGQHFFSAWAFFGKGAWGDNCFKDSQLIADRTERGSIASVKN